MADILNQITQELNLALKAKEETKVGALRFLLSNIKNAQIAKGGELEDEEVRREIAKDAKRHKESIESFEKAGRGELAAKEKAELEVLQKYLPQELSREEIEKIVDEIIDEGSSADFGRVMGQVMAKIKDRADGNLVLQIVKTKLVK